MGREPTRRWGPRVIDIDIVLWDEVVMESETLTLPHPEFRKRAFVLAPLEDIAPVVKDPATGLTVRELLRSSDIEGEVRLYSA